VRDVAVSPDGRWIAAAGVILDAAAGKIAAITQGERRNLFGVAFSPDAERVAWGDDANAVRVWDSKTGELVFTLTGHTDKVHGVAFSPNGRRIASAGADGTIKLWDASTGQEVITFGEHGDAVHCVAFSPDGKHLASAGADRAVRVWRAGLSSRVSIPNVYTFQFWADGARSAGVTSPRNGPREAKLWEIATGREVHAFEIQVLGTLSRNTVEIGASHSLLLS